MKCPNCNKKAKTTRTFSEENGTVREHYCCFCSAEFTSISIIFDSDMSAYKLAKHIRSKKINLDPA